MVFIMPVLLRKKYPLFNLILLKEWIMLTGLCLLLFSKIAFADFLIQQAQTRLVDKVYVLNAEFDYNLTEVIIDALQNSVSLNLILNIKIERERAFFWNETIARLKQSYELKYYALSRQYVLKYSNRQENFNNLNAVLSRLNKLKNFPLFDKDLIENDQTYWVYLQIYLDIESLPVPLRPIAYLSSQWRLSSDWYVCPLKKH